MLATETQRAQSFSVASCRFSVISVPLWQRNLCDIISKANRRGNYDPSHLGSTRPFALHRCRAEIYACDIALKNEAEITGMAIVDIPGIGKAVGGVPQGALYYAEKLKHFKTREAHHQIERIMEKFLTICREAGVRHQVAECQGCPSDRILEGAHFFDLVIMGLRTYYQFGDRPGDSLVKVLDHAICPVLAVPPEYLAFQRVLIAYDRSIPASRTLQHFVHFANAYDFEIKLLAAHDDC